MEPARFSLRIHPIIMKKMKIIAEQRPQRQQRNRTDFKMGC